MYHIVVVQCTYPPVNEHVPGDFTTLISTLSHPNNGVDSYNMHNPKLGRLFNLLRSFFTLTCFSLHLTFLNNNKTHVEIFIQNVHLWIICPPHILPPNLCKRPPGLMASHYKFTIPSQHHPTEHLKSNHAVLEHCLWSRCSWEEPRVAWHPMGMMRMVTLHETNILPLENRPVEKEIPNLETSMFREYVSFKECNDEDGSNDDPYHHYHYHYHLSWIMTHEYLYRIIIYYGWLWWSGAVKDLP